MPGRQRSRSSASDSDTVTLKVAHHLNDGNPFTGVAQKPGDEVDLPRERARAMIGSGYAAVDPYDQVAVAEALGISEAEVAVGEGDGAVATE